MPKTFILLAVGAVLLSACSGTGDLVATAIETATGADRDETGNVAANVLYVENDTDGDVCHVRVTDFDEPDAAGYDLLEDEGPLAPGEGRTYEAGGHPLSDDHNLLATAEACDGETFPGYAFDYVQHGGSYSVRSADPPASE